MQQDLKPSTKDIPDFDLLVKTAADFFNSENCFFITYHSNPDDDAFGSAVALAIGLRSIGKTAEVSNLYPMASPVHPFRLSERPDEACGVLVDVGSKHRCDQNALLGKRIINIDHHHGSEIDGAVNVIYEPASSTSEIIYHILSSLGVVITPIISDYLYSGIYSDTDGFRSITTSPETLQVASDLAFSGANIHLIANRVQKHTVDYYKAMSELLVKEDHNLGVYVLRLFDINRDNITDNEAQSLPDRIYEATSKDTVILVNEIGENQVRVSIRSICNQNEFAKAIGGGGRSGAWAVTMNKSVEHAIEVIKENIDKIVTREDVV